jgi:hypothetical protein
MSARGSIGRTTTTNVIKEIGLMDSRSVPRAWRRFRALALGLVSAALLSVSMVSLAQADVSDFGFNGEAASISTAEAGAHPDFVTKFLINGDSTQALFGDPRPFGKMRDYVQEMPPGLIANTSAFPTCPTSTFVQQIFGGPIESESPFPFCNKDTQIGLIAPALYNALPPEFYRAPLFNLPAPPDSDIVARFGFIALQYHMFIDVRLDPKREYGVTATLKNTPSILPLTESTNTIWGVPTDHVHDDFRYNWVEAFGCIEGFLCTAPHASTLEPTPFMLNPTKCGPVEVGMSMRFYQDPIGFDAGGADLPDITDCDQVPFEPSLSLAPTTRSASTSSGVDLNIEIPQGGVTDPNGLASAHLKKAVVTLPQGVSLNPSAADGLGSCTQSQIGVDRIERQIIAIKSNGAGVKLTFGGQTTNEVPARASAAQVRAALEALPNVPAGDLAVSGREGGPWTIDFGGSLSGQDVPTIEGVQSEVARVIVRANGGTFTIGYDGDTTVPLAYDASAASVTAALEGLSGIQPGEVDVHTFSGDRGVFAPSSLIYGIAFQGGLGGTDLPAMTTTPSLTGEGNLANVYQLTQGGTPVRAKTVKQGGTLGFDDAAPACPQSSKVGTGTIITPVLPDPIDADLYLAKQDDNPFNSLLAGYLVAHGQGVMLKIPGKFDLDPQTGQIIGTFDNNPQQPFSELELHFKGGNRGVITTPEECGTYQTKYELTPWSGTEPVVGTSEFTIDEHCGKKSFSPGFNAGSSSGLAGGFTAFNVKVTRESGSPQLSGIAIEPPQGLTGRLAGIPYCPESALASIPSALGSGAGQLASPSCPAASQVGTVTAGAGSGAPFYLNTGKAYLTGPYKGAPVSLAIVTPAVSGPFDLGNVVIRTPLYIDQVTARVRAVSDPLPTILAGVPLDLRDVRVSIDRQGFTVNPTSCDPMSVDGQITGTSNASATVSDRFQVGECAALGFKPKLALKLKGGTTRGKHPALTATLRTRAGDANIASVSVAFPHAEFLDQSHIGTVCTRVQWAADQCPAASVYGTVMATSPLLDSPLTGNAYLRSSDNKLPDLVFDLRGPATVPIRLEAAGRNDSVNGGLRNSFGFIPAAPVSSVVLKMKGGKKGLLQNSRNLCAQTYRAKATYVAHNGRTYTYSPALQADCKGKKKAKRGKRYAGR